MTYKTIENHDIKVGECYQTRDGRKAFVAFIEQEDFEGEYYYPVVGVVTGYNKVSRWDSGGCAPTIKDAMSLSTLDLMRPWPKDKMKVTNEMIHTAFFHFYECHVIPPHGDRDKMRAALEAVFSLIEKEELSETHVNRDGTPAAPPPFERAPKKETATEEQPDNEGWIEYTDFWYRKHFEKMYWQCPDGIRKELVEIKRIDGTTNTGHGEWITWHEGITAYRVLPNQTPEKEACVCKQGGSAFKVYALNPVPTCVICNEPVTPPEKEKIPTFLEHSKLFYTQLIQLNETVPRGIIEILSEYLDKYMKEKV